MAVCREHTTKTADQNDVQLGIVAVLKIVMQLTDFGFKISMVWAVGSPYKTCNGAQRRRCASKSAENLPKTGNNYGIGLGLGLGLRV